ncbi:MAG: hypothetical protein FWD44_09310 [Oscillospiraceae bacterium]|nr:hypothetical protein [Oscillospiraceae bacterium]
MIKTKRIIAATMALCMMLTLIMAASYFDDEPDENGAGFISDEPAGEFETPMMTEAIVPLTSSATVIDLTGFNFSVNNSTGAPDWEYIYSGGIGLFRVNTNVEIIGTVTGATIPIQFATGDLYPSAVSVLWSAVFTGSFDSPPAAAVQTSYSAISITVTTDGKIENDGSAHALTGSSGGIIINGGEVSATGSGHAIGGSANVTVNSGTVSSASGNAIDSGTTVDAQVNIKGGMVSSTSGNAILANHTNAKINISGGTVKSISESAIIANGTNAQINMTGGTVSSEEGYAIEADGANAQINITDTTVTFDRDIRTDGSVNISNSKVTITNGQIWGGNVSISGGSVTVNSPYGLGIGAENSISIDGAIINITADTGYDDGIRANNGSITINNSDITILAEVSGIDASTITITDSTVNIAADAIGIHINGGVSTINNSDVTILSDWTGIRAVSVGGGDGDGGEVAKGSVIVGAGSNLTIIADNNGIWAEGDVVINGSLTITAGAGIYEASNVTINNGSSVIITATDEDGIDAEGSININGGSGVITGLDYAAYTPSTNSINVAPSVTVWIPNSTPLKLAEVKRDGERYGDPAQYFVEAPGGTTPLSSVEFGTLTVTVTGGTGGGAYGLNAPVTITADADTATKRFKDWTIQGVTSFTSGSLTTRSISFQMPFGNVTATANFSPLYTVTITGGKIDNGGPDFAEGEMVHILANTAPEGQRFKEWTTTSTGVTFANASNAQTTFTMPANAIEVTATYEPFDTVTVDSGTGGGSFDTGATVTITATVPEGYRFKEWEIDPATTLTFTTGSLTTATATFNMPANSIKATAVLEQLFTVTVTGGKIDNGGPQFAAGELVHLIATTPPDGQRFKDWTISPELTLVKGTLTNPDIEFTMPGANVTATANFEPLPPNHHVIIVAHTGNGVANPDVNSAAAGTVVTLTATPDAGNAFVRWEVLGGGITLSSTTTRTATFTMPDEAVSVRAVFNLDIAQTGDNYNITMPLIILSVGLALIAGGTFGWIKLKKIKEH